ncbi:MAG: hypothetical protein AB7S48_06865 [Bacteroidales bacterium]
MKKILLFGLLLTFFSAGAQETVTLKIIRPSKFQGSAAKIKVLIQGNEYVLKNGGTISVNVPLEYNKPTRIDCKSGLNKPASIYIHPKSGQVYEFEVGFSFKGLYINLVSGEEAKLGEMVGETDSVLVDGKWEKRINIDRGTLGIGFQAEKIDKSEAIRQEWLARGGKIMYTSIMFTGTYFKLDMDTLGVMDGYGAGVSANMNWIKLKIPKFKSGLSTWNSSNIGWGYDLLIYSFKYGSDMDIVSYDMTTTTMTILLNLNLGWTFGFGHFVDEGNWKGVAFTFKYKPSLNLNYSSIITEIKSTSSYIPNSTTTDSDGNVQFNAGGFGFDMDFAGYSATMNKLVPKPKTKLSFFFLPPVGDAPLFISVSLGMSFYSR